MKNNLCIDITGQKSGGGDIFATQILKNLDYFIKDYNKIIIFAKNNENEIKYKNKNIVYLSIPYIFRNKFLIFFWQNLLIDYYLKKFSCKIFLSMNSIYLGSFKSYVIIHQNSLPFSNLEIKKYSNKIFKYKLILQRYLLRKTYLNALCTIFLTQHAHNLVQKYLNKKIEYQIIPLGIQDYFNRPPEKNNKLVKKFHNKSEIKILYVSSLHLYKNHKKLFQAVKILLDEYPNIKLILIGEKISFLFNEIFDDIYSDIKQSIIYLENISNYNIKNHHFETDLFIFPSSCETFPLSLLESMKASVPVAVSNYIKEINVVNKEMISFDPNDSTDISKKIKYLIENPNLRKYLVEKSYKFVNNYNWTKTNKKIFKLLENFK